MHYLVLLYILGTVLKLEGCFLLLPVIVGLIYGEKATVSFVIMAVVCVVAGYLMASKKPKKMVMYAREGLAGVALSWIILSIAGALPFVINGDIPSFTDALFETISGFTTTGASILTDVEALSHASLFWRSFTHWVGGMGVIVFMLAVIPAAGGSDMHLMRAESPGPSVGKLVPKVKESAKILYLIYFVMTAVETILLIIAGMPVFDSFCLAFGTAGTGGFGVLNSSIADYSILCQAIITIFMIMFGVNFNAYYFLLGRDKKAAFKMEEVRWYLGIIAASIILITINVRGYFDNIFLAFHHVAFQVGSIITTTGYSTVNFDLWPSFSKCILVTLMFIGACAGSTGGGIKVSRIILLGKTFRQEINRFVHPKSINIIKMDDKAVDKDTVRSVLIYLATYFLLYVVSLLIVSLDPSKDLLTDFTAVAATFNNIGPGLAQVGPSANFSTMTVLSKYVLMFDMLAGRLELYPMLILFVPRAWKRT